MKGWVAGVDEGCKFKSVGEGVGIKGGVKGWGGGGFNFSEHLSDERSDDLARSELAPLPM